MTFRISNQSSSMVMRCGRGVVFECPAAVGICTSLVFSQCGNMTITEHKADCNCATSIALAVPCTSTSSGGEETQTSVMNKSSLCSAGHGRCSRFVSDNERYLRRDQARRFQARVESDGVFCRRASRSKVSGRTAATITAFRTVRAASSRRNNCPMNRNSQPTQTFISSMKGRQHDEMAGLPLPFRHSWQ